MFEAAELGHRVGKKEYERELPELREQLLDAQFELAERAAFPVIILIGGVDGAGKGETVNTLNYWMDPRGIQTNAMAAPNSEERLRPPMWRFWRALPPRGSIGIFFGSWYTTPIIDRVFGKITDSDLDARIDEIRRFEDMLTAEGALILKFWFHLSKNRQRKRLKTLHKDPATRWRVADTDWEHFALYDTFHSVSERTLRLTSQAIAPWTVVEGTDKRYRELTVGRQLLNSLRDRLDTGAPTQPQPGGRGGQHSRTKPKLDNRTVLTELDLFQQIPRDQYRRELDALQRRLNRISRRKKFSKRAVVVVMEGNDAAGKGGAIRRLAAAVDARFIQMLPIAAPTEDERAQPYLWRFWRHVPAQGHFTVFDRSWYGRVLVERVENYCAENDWRRAYSEINDFEAELTRHGVIVVKLWLAVSKEEQFRRFQERQDQGYKRFKITDEDWRNRESWDAYAEAVCDMVDHTSTEVAPWTLVEAEDKLWARIKVLRTVCERIEAALK
jgi:polyphosphate:AMP phosphotransferase